MLRYHNWGKELVERGHRVTIVAASTVHNTDIDVIEEIGRDYAVVDGVRYLYIETPRYQGNGVKRIQNMMAYCVSLPKIRPRIKRPDVIISPGCYKYPFVRRAFGKVPLIVDTVDLWPLSIIQYANVSERNPLIQYLYRLEKKAYLGADALIFSMEGGEEYLREQKYADRIDFGKVFHINMGCDIAQKDEELKSVQFDLGWDMDKFNLVYCGSIRQANQVQQICDAAKELLRRGYDDIAFQIYGNGTDLEALQKYVKDHEISNVTFYGRIDKSQIPCILARSEANILTYKQVPLMKYGGSQSKLFDYLASGKPIICNGEFGYNLITRYDCGLVTEDQSAEAFANTVEELYKMDPEKRRAMGENARKCAELYDQPQLVDQLCEVLRFVTK
jgi:glycosyltransferase involved in cell wall biosynthesis